jgi:hypothetical protein
MPEELAYRLLEENRLVPWRDASLPSGDWYLNHCHVPVPPVPHEGRCEIFRHKFILPSNLCDDLPFAIDSYN